MASPILATAAGANAGLQDLVAAQRETEWKRLQDEARTTELVERHRANVADESFRTQQMQQTGAYQQNMLASLDKDRAERAADRAADNARLGNTQTLATLAMRPIGTAATIEEQNRELAAGAPTSLYGTERSFGPPLSGEQGEQGPAMPTLPFFGTEAQQLARQKEANDKAQAENAAAAIAGQREFTNALGLANLGERRRTGDRLESYGPPVVNIYNPNSPTGTTVTPRGQAAGQAGAPPVGIQTQVIKNEASTSELDRLGTAFEKVKDKVGPVGGRARAFGQKLPEIPGVNPTDPDFAEFQAITAAVRNKIINSITGAQVGGTQEAARIMEQIPGEGDRPDVWRAKFDATKRNLADLERVMAQKGAPAPASDGQSTVTPSPATGAAGSSRYQRYLDSHQGR